jgi:hypothetical protein
MLHRVTFNAGISPPAVAAIWASERLVRLTAW